MGSAEIMASEMRHLLEVAAMPNVTLTVMPPVLHPASESGFMVASDAAYAEHVAAATSSLMIKRLRPWQCASIRFVRKAARLANR